MQALTAPSFGLLNALAYGLDPDLRNLWLDRCTTWGLCGKRSPPPKLPEVEEEPDFDSISSEEADVTFRELE